MLLIRGTFRLAHLEENRNIDGITSPPTTSPNSKQTRSSCTGSGSAHDTAAIVEGLAGAGGRPDAVWA